MGIIGIIYSVITQTQNRNELISSTVCSCCPKWLIWRLNLGFWHFKSAFQMPFLSVATFFLYVWFSVWVAIDILRMRHVFPCYHLKFGGKSVRVLVLHTSPKALKAQSCFETSARLLNDWFGPKWMCSLKCWISCSLNMDVDWVFWGYVMCVRFVFLIIPLKSG